MFGVTYVQLREVRNLNEGLEAFHPWTRLHQFLVEVSHLQFAKNSQVTKTNIGKSYKNQLGLGLLVQAVHPT